MMDEISASVDRAFERAEIARSIAQQRFADDDDLDVPDAFPGVNVEYVDEGYWVEARVFVSADEVEDRLTTSQG